MKTYNVLIPVRYEWDNCWAVDDNNNKLYNHIRYCTEQPRHPDEMVWEYGDTNYVPIDASDDLDLQQLAIVRFFRLDWCYWEGDDREYITVMRPGAITLYDIGDIDEYGNVVDVDDYVVEIS